MNASRLAVWLIGAAVGGAWLASAAGVSHQARLARLAPRAAEAVQFDALALDVQAQTGRLRERLASAPAPSAAERNPFQFASRPVRRVRSAAVDVPAPLPAAPPPEVREPALELIGIAENREAGGIVRTAMIAGGFDELIMVTAGQRVLGRYDVLAVGADAVELKDLETGGTRRLVLR